MLISFWRLKPGKSEYNQPIIYGWFVFIALHFCYGIYMAEDYYDWKNLLNNVQSFLIPLCALALYKPERLLPFLGFWLRNSWIVFIIGVCPFISNSSAIGKFSAPFTIPLLFFPIISKRIRIITIVVMLSVLIFAIGDRSDVIKILVCAIIAISLQFKVILRHLDGLIKIFRYFAFFAPFVFFILGISGTFNVFNIEEYVKDVSRFAITNMSGESENLTADTRTILYEEAIVSSIKHNYYIQGRSMARGYDSPFFSYIYDTDKYKGNKPGERYAAESLIVTLFTYFGIIGVIFYFIIFLVGTKRAIYESNNIYVKMLGVYLSFRWMWLWVEDFVRFDMNTITLWIIFAMCLSPYFRNLTDVEFRKVMSKL